MKIAESHYPNLKSAVMEIYVCSVMIENNNKIMKGLNQIEVNRYTNIITHLEKKYESSHWLIISKSIKRSKSSKEGLISDSTSGDLTGTPCTGEELKTKMFETIRRICKRKPSLEKRLTTIETLLEGEDTKPESSNWSYKDIREILDKTDLVPDMSNQELQNIAPSYARIEKQLYELGQTDNHTGPKTLKYRLEMIEGCISILHSSHLGHTNYAKTEFIGMHGYNPSQTDEQLKQRVDGMQKKLDRVTKLLENAEFTLKGKDAMKL